MQIFGDWGTTCLRLFRVDGPRRDRLEGPGIGKLGDLSPAGALITSLGPWQADARTHGVLLSGMAGGRGGLVELPYLSLPVGAEGWCDAVAEADVRGIRVHVATGLRGTNFAGRADVMRGEETQIFGAMNSHPNLATGCTFVVLPGTHSKWVELIDGQITRFHSFPTGELFGLLRDHSSLSARDDDKRQAPEGFAAGMTCAQDGILASLFEARAARLTSGRDAAWSRGFLSGLLIASEFREALALLDRKPERIVIIGEPDLIALYGKAAQEIGIESHELDGDASVLAGLQLISETHKP